MRGLDVPCQTEQRGRVVALTQQQEAVHTEVLLQQGVGGLCRKLLPDVLLEKGGMASGTVALAVRNLHGQSDPVGNLLQDYVRKFGYILQHDFSSEA